jgi:hypothetical protein
MEIRCKYCQEFFQPSAESLEMIAGDYITSDSLNTCDSCLNLKQLSEFDYSDSFSDTDPGL